VAATIEPSFHYIDRKMSGEFVIMLESTINVNTLKSIHENEGTVIRLADCQKNIEKM